MSCPEIQARQSDPRVHLMDNHILVQPSLIPVNISLQNVVRAIKYEIQDALQENGDFFHLSSICCSSPHCSESFANHSHFIFFIMVLR